MHGVPFWFIYSYWVFGLTILWVIGLLTWSPLLSAVLAFIGSSFPVIFKNQFTEANIFIVVTHLIPIWILRRTTIDPTPNVLVFVLYNLVLLASGTNYLKVYTYIFAHVPTTIRGYLSQRSII